MFSSSYEPTLVSVAKALGMERDWLYNVVRLESGWSPTAYNPSGAVGLIQFMPKTLKDLNLLSSSLAARVPFTGPVPEAVKQAVRAEFLAKYPDVESQLQGPVLLYFRRYRPYPDAQSVYMTVFYPAYRTVSPDTVFPGQVQAQNPGIVTVADYVAKAEGGGLAKTASVSLLALAAAGLAAYAIYQSS